MDAMHPNVESGSFPTLSDGLLQLLFRFGHNLFNPAGVDTAIDNQSFESYAGNFPPDRVEARNDDRLWSIVHNQINPCGRLQSPNIPTLSSNNPSLHFFI